MLELRATPLGPRCDGAIADSVSTLLRAGCGRRWLRTSAGAWTRAACWRCQGRGLHSAFGQPSKNRTVRSRVHGVGGVETRLRRESGVPCWGAEDSKMGRSDATGGGREQAVSGVGSDTSMVWFDPLVCIASRIGCDGHLRASEALSHGRHLAALAVDHGLRVPVGAGGVFIYRVPGGKSACWGKGFGAPCR